MMKGFESKEAPIFKKRCSGEKTLVRFWSSEEEYKRFADAVRENDLKIKDVFNEFMTWFAESNDKGSLILK